MTALVKEPERIASSKVRGEESKAKFGLIFLMHQLIAIWVTLRSAPILTASAFNLLRLFGGRNRYPTSLYWWVLVGTPYFPVQICLGALLGWLLGRHLRQREMFWVWFLPFAFLCYAFVAIPTLTPALTPSEFQAGIGQSRLAHYFGWGCQPVNHCIDQESITSPFYATAAYSLAAFLAQKITDGKRPATLPQRSVLMGVGIVFLVATIYDFIRSVHLGWHWMLLPVAAVPAGIGAYLILLAFAVKEDAAR